MGVIACGLTQCGGHDLTGAGWLALIAVIVAIGLPLEIYRERHPQPPREPRTDLPPGFLDLMTGSRRARYTAPVSAVTPGGITVGQAACCRAGHQSPAQAVSHARRIAARIERTGR